MYKSYSEWLYNKLYEASSEELYNRFYNNIKREDFYKIVNADSDPRKSINGFGKSTKWLLKLYKEGKLKLEDLYKAAEYLNLYYKNFNKLSIDKRDINKYQSINDLYDEVEKYENQDEEISPEKQELNDIKTKETRKLYEDDEWIVLIPLTQRSSCFWGLGTKWCTAAKKDDENQFNYYNEKGTLYIIISKTKKDTNGRQVKYQFHFETNQYMDVKDKSINPKEIGLTNDVFNAIKNNIIKEQSSKAAYMWARDIGDQDEMKHIVLNSNDVSYIYRWALYIGDKEEMKPIVININDPQYAYMWALTIGNKDEMKPIVINANDTEYAYKWALNIGDKEEMKQIIINGNNVEYAYWWAREIGDKEEMKQVIINNNNPQYAYWWAKDIGDQDEMKPIVINANDPEYVYYWAIYIGNIDEMKQIIINSNNFRYINLWNNNFKNDKI